MKYISYITLFFVSLFYITATIFTAQALEINLDIIPPANAQTTNPSPTESVQPSTTPQPSTKPSTSPQPSGSPTPSVAPSTTVTPILSVSVSITTPITSITPTISTTIVPTVIATASATPKPEKNTGGTDVASVNSTPTPTVPTNTPTPTASPTPIPAAVGNIQPPAPVKKLADDFYKNVVVAPLSFLLHKPQQDFYKEKTIGKTASYALSILATLTMIAGTVMAFPNHIARFLSDTKSKMFAQRSFKLFKTRQV